MKITSRPGRFLLSLLLLALSLVATAAERTVYFVNDAQGSPVAAMDQQGEVLWRESYAPYGERRTKAADNNGKPAYTGKPEDADTSLVYMHARMYDPETARFTGIDPVAFRMDSLQSFNRYLYGANSPYVYVDPDGREEVNFGELGEKLVQRARADRAEYGSRVEAELRDSGEIAVGAAATIATGVVGRGVAGSGSVWSSTKGKSAIENAYGHWKKHRDEFPELNNAKQYAERAKSFLTNPPSGTLTKTNARGDTLRYDPGTNTFGVLGKDGAPRTMFRPKDGMDYWNRQ